jgi:DNA-binding NarL/FixJ family response regulator
LADASRFFLFYYLRCSYQDGLEDMRIVLADDQIEVRSALRVLLEHHSGLQVVGEAMDPEELEQQLTAAQPDLLLLDWEMLGVRANEILSNLQDHYPRLRIIVMSGQPGVRWVALAAGADAFVSKGNPPDQLLDTLEKVIGATGE